MIISSRQRKQISQYVRQLKSELDDLKNRTDLPEIILNTKKTQLLEDLNENRFLIEAYDDLLELDTTKPMFINSFDAFKKLPIVCRIANKLTVSDFSGIIDTPTKTIQRYEERLYQQCDMKTFEDIVLSLKQNGYLGEVVFNLGSDNLAA